MVAFNFNAAMYDPNAGVDEVFEGGEYMFHIVSSDTQVTKKGDGTMLVFGVACLNEGFMGKRMTIRLNLQNPSAQAVEIALRDLSAISYVVGLVEWQNTQQLHGRPFRMRLEKVPRADAPGKFSNNILGYLDANGNPPKAQGVAAATTAPVAPPPPSAPVTPPVQQYAPPAPPPPAFQPPAPAQPAQPPAFAQPGAGVPLAPHPVAPPNPGAAPSAPWVPPATGAAPTPPWVPPSQ